MCCYWLFSSDCDWLKSPDSEWLFQPDSNTVIEHNLLLVTGIVKKMVYRTAPIGGDREETGDGSLSPLSQSRMDSAVFIAAPIVTGMHGVNRIVRVGR